MTKMQQHVLCCLGAKEAYVLDKLNRFKFDVSSDAHNVLCRFSTHKDSYYEVRIELSEDNGTLGATLYQCDKEYKSRAFINWVEI